MINDDKNVNDCDNWFITIVYNDNNGQKHISMIYYDIKRYIINMIYTHVYRY